MRHPRLCGFHHQLVTHRGFAITGTPGHWTWITPKGLDQNGERILSDEVVESLAKEADERQALFDGY